LIHDGRHRNLPESKDVVNKAWVMKQLSLTISFLALWAALGLSQTEDAGIRLRLAQGFEQSGDWERALRLYESLYREAPLNQVYFDGLRRGYIQLKEYQRAVDLIQSRLQLQKDDPVLLTSLGGVYYQMGREERADTVWKAVLSKNPSNSSLYRLVASQLMEFRLYDSAIRTFLDARRATGNETLFIEELAGLYGAFQQYDKAAAEYFRMLRAQPQQLSYIQSRMSVFLSRPDALKPIQKLVREEIRQNEKFVPLRQMSAWLHMEGKDYLAALEEYRIIDRMTGASGSELFNFAQRAMLERAYFVAATAWKEVLDRDPSAPMIPIARFNYARAIEELSAGADTSGGRVSVRRPAWPVSETQPSFGAAVGLFDAVARDFPRSEFAARALFRIGVIRSERLFDLDGALRAFEEVRTMLPAHPVAADATLEIAGVHTLRNNLDQARLEYTSLAASNRQEVRDQARFRTAEIAYYEGRFDTAKATLGSLALNLQTDLANDALQLLYFVEENMATSPEGLREFARTDLLVRQRKYSEAMERLLRLTTDFPRALLIDDAYMKMAELQVLMGKPAAAVANLATIINEMAFSILRDRALMRTGEIYERELMNPTKALEIYEQLLARFPNSLHAEEARRRIRSLRGDAI